MGDQEVREDHPFFPWHDLNQVLFDLFRRLLLRETKPMR
jgi:hypothetical protein